MFCSACGQPIDAWQPFCPRCGRQVTPIPTATPPPWIWTRVHRHVHSLGILWIAYAGWTLLHWFVAVGFLAGAFHNWGFPFEHGFGFYSFPFENMPWLIPIITTILLVRAVLCVVTGIALLRRAPWARCAGAGHGISDPDSAHHRNRTGHLYAVGTAAQRFRSGVRPDRDAQPTMTGWNSR